MKIYISGKITGLPIEQAKAAFAEAEAVLQEQGHEPVNPFNLPHQHGGDWSDYMAEDIRALLQCEALHLLPNSADSKGVKVELAIARALDMIITY